MLIVKDVIKKFKDKTVLKGVSFEIKGQEIVAILGVLVEGKPHCFVVLTDWKPMNKVPFKSAQIL